VQQKTWRSYLYDHVTAYDRLSRPAKMARVLVISVRNFIGGEYSKQATALTYYTLFAIVPLAALFFGIAKGFSLEERLKGLLGERFADHQETLTWIYRFADTTLHQARGGLIAGIGVILLFVTVIMLASSVEDTFNIIWHLPKRRNILRKSSDYLAIMVVTPLLLIIAGSAAPVTHALLVGIVGRTPEYMRQLLPLFFALVGLLPLIISWALFFAIYFFVPNTKVRIASALVAALVAGTAFHFFQNSLILLQTALSKYNTIYGSFAALPLFLIWLQWSWLIVLFGAELGFVHQNASLGRFEEEKRKLNLRSRRYYLCGIVRLVTKNYDRGGPPLTEELIARDLQLTLYQIRDCLNELIDSGVLLKTVDADGNCGVVPSLPGAKLTMTKVREMLESQGAEITVSEPALANIIAVTEKLNAEVAANPANKPLRDL
jgi:membrane protein